jgi:hypothetical protein
MTQKHIKVRTQDFSNDNDLQHCQQRRADQREVDEALELMRAIVRAPLGEYPERDKKIIAAWQSRPE